MDPNAASDERAGFERFRRVAETGQTEFVARDKLLRSIENVFSQLDCSQLGHEHGEAGVAPESREARNA